MRQPRYPIYIISKGRSDSLYTARTLHEMGIDFQIVIEPQEYNDYEKGMLSYGIDPSKILVLPFSNLGLGSIPVRNWVWEHSIATGAERHWVLDDNLRYFYALYKNTRLRINSSVPFRVCEDYSDRFTNVAMSGLNYYFFMLAYAKKPPAYFNTRIYSCILLSNKIEERWRVLEWAGKPAPFNEDTDLSLQVLKKGYCTILLNSFSCGKMATMVMKGGNTDTVYKIGKEGFDNRYAFAAALEKAHPDCTQVVKKHGRYHHLVDYSGFQKNNKLILKPGITWADEYDTKLKLVKLHNPKELNSARTDIDINSIRMGLDYE